MPPWRWPWPLPRTPSRWKRARFASSATIATPALSLGATRVGLVAITLVLIFDALMPAQATPTFLVGSQLRPLLSAAGQKGFRSLPPEVAATIDRLKAARRI